MLEFMGLEFNFTLIVLCSLVYFFASFVGYRQGKQKTENLYLAIRLAELVMLSDGAFEEMMQLGPKDKAETLRRERAKFIAQIDKKLLTYESVFSIMYEEIKKKGKR